MQGCKSNSRSVCVCVVELSASGLVPPCQNDKAEAQVLRETEQYYVLLLAYYQNGAAP